MTPPPAPPPPDGLMKWPDLLQRPRPEPDATVHYGPAALQVVDIWLPKGPGFHPVVLMVHGGCWQSDVADRRIMNWIADDLRKRGIAVWNIDYRGVDRDGGGYPGTFLDVAAAADALRAHAVEYRLDISRMLAFGHSAGGHLALWLAGRTERSRAPFTIRVAVEAPGVSGLNLVALEDIFRTRVKSPSWRTSAGRGRFSAIFQYLPGTDPAAALNTMRALVPELQRHLPRGASTPEVSLVRMPQDSPLIGDDPLSMFTVIASGALPDLALTETPPGTGCGLEVVRRLVGSPTPDRPDVLTDTSAAELPSIQARQILVNGDNDRIVPLGFAAAYQTRRAKWGETVDLHTVPRTGHVELIAPDTEAWRRQVALIESILNAKSMRLRIDAPKPR